MTMEREKSSFIMIKIYVSVRQTDLVEQREWHTIVGEI